MEAKWKSLSKAVEFTQTRKGTVTRSFRALARNGLIGTHRTHLSSKSSTEIMIYLVIFCRRLSSLSTYMLFEHPISESDVLSSRGTGIQNTSGLSCYQQNASLTCWSPSVTLTLVNGHGYVNSVKI
jgi:hypothetical protein